MSAENDQPASKELRPQDEIARQSVVDHADHDEADEADSCNADWRDGGYASDPPLSLLYKLLQAQLDIKELEKDATNTYDGYRYTSADAIIAEARRALNGAGLIVRRERWSIVADKVVSDHLSVVSSFIVEDPDTGQRLWGVCPYPFAPKRGNQWDKALSAALTTCFAYWLRDLLAIPRSDAEVDKGGDKSDENTPGTRRGKRPPAKDGGRAPASTTVIAAEQVSRATKATRAAELEDAYADLIVCVRMHNPEETADDDVLRAKAAEHFKVIGKVPTAELVREMTKAIAAKYDDTNQAETGPDDAGEVHLDQDRQRVLDQISSNKWASRVFDPLRASAEFAKKDAVRYLQVRGIDISTKQGRVDLSDQLSAGIDWNAADLQEAESC